MLQVVDCKSGTEVFDNYRQVRARLRKLPPPKPTYDAVVADNTRLRMELISLRAETDRLKKLCGGEEITHRPVIKEIIKTVSEVFDISEEDILSRRHQPMVAQARHIVFALARRLTLLSLPEIGRRCGGKDHTTVIHALNKVKPIIDRVAEQVPSDAPLIKWVDVTYAVAKELRLYEPKPRNG